MEAGVRWYLCWHPCGAGTAPPRTAYVPERNASTGSNADARSEG